MTHPNIIARLSDDVLSLLNIPPPQDKNVYIGATNIQHMQSSHPADYQKYHSDISLIIEHPDYVGLNKKDNSIEFVKEYLVDNEFVKVAVRISSSNRYYARSIYILNNRRVKNFIAKNTLIPLTKK